MLGLLNLCNKTHIMMSRWGIWEVVPPPPSTPHSSAAAVLWWGAAQHRLCLCGPETTTEEGLRCPENPAVPYFPPSLSKHVIVGSTVNSLQNKFRWPFSASFHQSYPWGILSVVISQNSWLIFEYASRKDTQLASFPTQSPQGSLPGDPSPFYLCDFGVHNLSPLCLEIMFYTLSAVSKTVAHMSSLVPVLSGRHFWGLAWDGH